MNFVDETKQAGKDLRANLRTAFPSTKFSVTMDRGTAWGWYNVTYTDGPASRKVQQLVYSMAGQFHRPPHVQRNFSTDIMTKINQIDDYEEYCAASRELQDTDLD